MTDLRSTADDAFERELRAALLASTSPHAPRSLSLAAASIVARPARVHHGPWGRAAAVGLAAALGLAVIGFGLGPVASILRPAIAPAASPTAALPSALASPAASSVVPSATPVTASASPSVTPSVAPTPPRFPAYDLRTDWVRLTADEIVVELDGERSLVDSEMSGGGGVFVTTPSRWLVPYVLGVGGRTMVLHLRFRADATDWWVERARLIWGPRPITEVDLRGPDLRIPIGEALRGDITFTGEKDGTPVRLAVTGMTLDPVGLGTGPHDWEGCTRFTDLDAAAKASLRDAKRPTKLAGLAEQLDLCVVYLWSFGSTEGGHLTEVWCTPPTSGVIRSVRAGESGEAVVFVIDAPRRQEPRPQPVEGWGCGSIPGSSPGATPTPIPQG